MTTLELVVLASAAASPLLSTLSDAVTRVLGGLVKAARDLVTTGDRIDLDEFTQRCTARARDLRWSTLDSRRRVA